LKVKGIQSTSDIAAEDEMNRKAGSKPAGTTEKNLGSIPGTISGSGSGKPLGVPSRFGSASSSAPKTQEAREYKGGSQDTDFKIDRFGDK
jgi:hypothetical protein